VLMLTYHGMKPLSADVHQALAAWVKRGGVLVVCDMIPILQRLSASDGTARGSTTARPARISSRKLGLPSENTSATGEISPVVKASLKQVGKRRDLDARETPPASPRWPKETRGWSQL